MKKQILTDKKGITLIALVVTIVVLLILAGVSISMLTGENGIITQAKEAKEATRGGEIKERVELAINENAMLEYTKETKKTKQEVIGELEAEGLLTEKEAEELETEDEITIGGIEIDFSKLVVAEGKTLVEMFKNAQNDNCAGGASCTKSTEHLHIGDYLDYKPVSGNSDYVEKAETGYDGTQTYTVDMSTTWRVLGLNEDETEILITSGSPIKKDDSTGTDPYLHLSGAEAYAYCVETLDKISNVYHNSKYASKTRSMKIEDINKALGIVKEGNNVYKASDASKNNIDMMGVLGEKYAYESGDFAPENYLYTAGDTTQPQRSVGYEETGTAYGYIYADANLVDPNSAIYDVLFADTLPNEETGTFCSKAYWLASPGVRVYSSGAFFGPGVVGEGRVGSGFSSFHSYGCFYEYWFGVRPVVSLISSITENEVAKTTKTEVEWTTSVPESPSDQQLTSGQVLEVEIPD